MQKNEQANLLSIFAFIFAGIQSFALLFVGLYAFIMLGVLVLSALDPNARGDPATFLVPGFIVLLFGAMAIFGLTNVLLNIKMGRALRGARPPSQKRVIVTSIFSICSFFCGGVFIAPFGMALGIFGIVFAASEKGKAFLSGMPGSFTLPPAPPHSFENHSAPKEHVWRQ
jgi:hypothetical protein